MTQTQIETDKKPKSHRSLSIIDIIKRGFFLALGSILVSIALEVFLIPNSIIDGGIIGSSIMASHLSGISLGILLVILNLPFFYIGYKQIGKTFAISSIFAIAMLAIGITYLHDSTPFTNDLLLATVFGGLISGIGTGLIIRYGGSLDGVEILGILFNKKLPFSVGEIIMFFNFFILSSAGFVFGWDRAMYSLVAYYIAFKTIDLVVEGLDESKQAWIVSNKDKEIGEAILSRLGRGVTYLNGEGGFSGTEKKVIFCIVTRLEEAKLKSIVEEIDSEALLAVGHISEVQGGTGKKKAIH